MAIPGLKPTYDVRAKVRIGVKRAGQNGREFPSSVDYFVCDDAEFVRLVPGAQPRVLRIIFPFAEAEDNFSTGMEWWVRSKKGNNVLACYTKDSGSNPTALRMSDMVGVDDEVRGEPLKGGRVPIKCGFRECPIFKRKDCKPMGRLQFFLDGGKRDAVYQLDTKSWNSIEALVPVLEAAGDPRGRVFELSVAFVQKGRDRYPVLSLTEADMKIETEADVVKADAGVALAAAVDSNDGRRVRHHLAALLDIVRPTWREQQDYIDRIKEIGAEAAAKALLAKLNRNEL